MSTLWHDTIACQHYIWHDGYTACQPYGMIRHWPIMPLFVPIMLWYSALKFDLLCSHYQYNNAYKLPAE